MTVTLGAITLSDHLVLQGLETAPRAMHSARRTLGGNTVVTIGPPLAGGRTLVLQGENHFDFAAIAAVKLLEASRAVVSLVHPRGTFAVRVIAVDVAEENPHSNPTTADWLSGTITLLEV